MPRWATLRALPAEAPEEILPVCRFPNEPASAGMQAKLAELAGNLGLEPGAALEPKWVDVRLEPAALKVPPAQASVLFPPHHAEAAVS